MEVSAKFNGHDSGKKNEHGPMSFEEWCKKNTQPRISDDSYYSEEENCQHYWGLHKKYKEYLKDWDTQKFGPDLDEAWGTESNPPKAIVRVPSETIIQIPPVDSESTAAEPTETIQEPLEASTNNRNRRAKSRSSNQE